LFASYLIGTLSGGKVFENIVDMAEFLNAHAQLVIFLPQTFLMI